jgi:hypothetical protein
MLTAEQKAALVKFPIATVPIPEAGEGAVVILRRMDAARDLELWPLNHRITKEKVGEDLVEVIRPIQPGHLVRKVIACECDEAGKYAYPISREDHAEFDAAVENMMQWPPRVFDRIYAQWETLNPQAPSPEEAAKNS